MYIVLKEAFEKTCPMGIPHYRQCNGDNCAAWRWKDRDNYSFLIKWCEVKHTLVEPPRPDGIKDYEFVPFDPVEGIPAHCREPREEAMKRREGYCGMAGKP